MSKPRPPCGTYSGYQAHLRRGQTTCAECRKALADYMRDYRRRRKDAAQPD